MPQIRLHVMNKSYLVEFLLCDLVTRCMARDLNFNFYASQLQRVLLMTRVSELVSQTLRDRVSQTLESSICANYSAGFMKTAAAISSCSSKGILVCKFQS